MIGFSFLHTSSLALPVVLAAFIAQFWVALTIIWVACGLWKGRAVERQTWLQLGILALPVGVLLLLPAIA
jgi:hypothetical protein